MLLAAFMAVTSVGWVHAQDGPTITTDLTVAQKGRAIVFGITTKKGNAGDMNVRASLTATDNAFDTWDSYYYEPNSGNPGWVKWDPKNEGFGPAEGFSLMDATSYIKVVPKETGTFSYTLKVTKVDGTEVTSMPCELEVKDEPVSPVASIGDTDYASLPTAVLFAEKGNTIKLSKGDFDLNQMLVIDKPLTISGAGTGPEGTGIQCRIVEGQKQWSIPAGKVENEYKHLLAILNGSAGETVTIEGLNISGALASGLNAQSAMKVVLKSVGMVDNANAGLLVHSDVEATGIYTIDNKWGGVNIDQGKTSYSPSFTFDATSTFAEQSKIWSELKDAESAVNAPEGWTSYLGVQGTSSKEMWYWTNSKLTFENVANFYTDKTLNKGYTLVYANGNPVTVEASGSDKIKISAGTDDVLEIETAKNPIIFGGAKFGDVESSNITMKGGKVEMIIGGGYLGNVKNANVTVSGGEIVNLLVGGGYGPKQAFDASKRQTADITGKATVKIDNAKVRYLISAGLMYAKTKAVDVEITGENTQLTYILGGGYAPVGIGQTEQTDYATIANGVETTNFKMTNGKITGDLFVGGGYSYSYSKNVTAILNDVECVALLGTGSNGCSDNVKIEATGCKFVKATNWPLEIAAVNRGKVGSVSMDFKNCTFPATEEAKYIYLGATYQWQTSSFPIPTAENISFTFDDKCTNTPVVGVSEGIQNVVLNGAVANVGPFSQKKNGTDIKEFTISEGNVWALNKGLTVAEGCKLINNGTLVVSATDIMAGIAVGGALAVDTTSTAVVAEMNKASDKKDLKEKTFSIECKDGVIASNKTVAKELLKAGKVVMLLSFSGETYSIASYQKTLAKITNLPDSVVYGTAPIKLEFNLENVTATVSDGSSNVVEINNGVLTIKKPGTVTLSLSVTDDADAANTQALKVTKRTLTLTAGIVPDYGTENKGDSIVYNANTDVTLKWDAANIAVSGLPWDANAFISKCFETSTAPTGSRANKNVGPKVPVIVNEITIKDSADYYVLAPITFVTAKVVKAQATVTANNVTDYTFGSELPTFKATTTDVKEGDKLDGTLKFICSATPDSLVKEGGYDIMPYGQTSDNYAIKYVAGKLTVVPADPKIEIVDVKVTGTADAKTITVRANLVHSGGATTAATVTAAATTKASGDAINKGTDGYYTYTVSGATAATHTVTFTATSGDKTGTASIDVTVAKGTPQNLAFDDKVLSSIVYGDSLALIVSSDQTGATGKYTFSATVDGVDAKIISANNVLKPTVAKDVVVTVSRAADDSYSSATITKTIKVTPRPLKAEVAAFTKKYDGNVTATVPDIKLSTDYKVIGSDQVSIKTSDISATYASKNVGTHAITLSTLTLEGDQADNYTLIQPTGLKGEITKKDATVKVDDVTRMYNQRYTKYSFTATDLVEGESLSSVYTGKLDVTENEKEATLILNINTNLCQNYNLKAENGKLTIKKGTPVVVAYKDGETPKALVVDSAGHQNLEISKDLIDGYFRVTGDEGSVTNSVNAIVTAAPANVLMNALLVTKASEPDWTGWNSDKATPIEYAKTGNITSENDYTYSSTNLNRLTIDADGSLAATGVGKVAIIATSTSGDVKVKLYEVTPKKATYKADMSKTYDGLTQATGTVTLDGVVSNDNVVLDLDGVTFNYASPAAGTKAINPSQAPILTGADANNYNLASKVTGKIDQKAIKVSAPISAYYTGSKDMVLDEFTAEGILSNDIVSLSVTLDNETVGTARKFKLEGLGGDNAANYTLSNTEALEGTILKPTIIVTVPETASSTTDAKNKLTYTIRETGKPVSGAVFSDAVQVISLGNNVYQVSTGKEDPNFSLVYTSNSIGYKAAPTPPAGGGDEGDETVTISLDATTKTLPRNEEFVLKATVSPSDKTVTWSSSDPTIASVTANGNSATVKALKVGTATITAKIGDVTATCEVTVDFATGLEEALANTQVYAKQGSIYVNPIQPLQLTIVNMLGKTVYNARISSYAQIPVTNGIYIVKLTNAGNTIVTKVNVY